VPYIKENQRVKFQFALDLLKDNIKDAGELNYVVTSICHQLLRENGVKYAKLNEIVGALECAKLELYRRIAVPYEDSKIAENGDVNI
jgi:hypothetical protein